MNLCGPCSERICEDRVPLDCDDTTVCQCPCALAETPDEVAAFQILDGKEM
jgi:hypothetical protein